MKKVFLIIILSIIPISNSYAADNTTAKKVLTIDKKVPWDEIYPIQIATTDDGKPAKNIHKDVKFPVKKIKIHSVYRKKLIQSYKEFHKFTKTKDIENINNVVIPEANDTLTEEEENIVRILRGMPKLDGEKLSAVKYRELIKKVKEEYTSTGRKFSNGRSISSYVLSKYWNKNFTKNFSTTVFKPKYDLNEYLYDGTTMIMNRLPGMSASATNSLLEGANPNLVSREGGATALHYAALESTKFSKGFKFNANAYKSLSFLLSYGADINAQTNGDWYVYEGIRKGRGKGTIFKNKIAIKGVTALMIIESNAKILSKLLSEFLIENGADVNLEDSNGNAAINYISLPTNRNGTLRLVQEKVEFLVRKGADPMHKDFEGKTIFDRIEEASSKKGSIHNTSKNNKLINDRNNIGIPYDEWVKRIKRIYRNFTKKKI